MRAQIELNAGRAAALVKLEQETGESRSSLLLKMFDSYIEQRREYEELAASVARGAKTSPQAVRFRMKKPLVACGRY